MSLSEKTGLTFLFPFLGNFYCFGSAGSWWMKGSHGFWERHRNNQGGKNFLVFLSSAPFVWKEAKRVQRCFSSQCGSIPVPLPKRDFWEHQEPCCCRALEQQKGSDLNPAGRCMLLCPHRPTPVLSGIRAALWKWRIPEPVVFCQDRGILS